MPQFWLWLLLAAVADDVSAALVCVARMAARYAKTGGCTMSQAIPEQNNNELQQRLKACKRSGVGLSVLAVVQSLLSVLFALAMRNVVNRAVVGESLRGWGLFLAFLSVVIPIVFGARRFTTFRISDRTVASLRQTVMRMIRQKRYDALQEIHGGVLLDRLLTDVFTVSDRYLRTIPAAVGQVAQLIGSMGVLWGIRAPVAVLALALGVVLAVLGLAFRRLLRKYYHTARDAEELLTACMQEELEQLEILRCADARQMEQRLETRQKKWRTSRLTLRTVQTGGATLFSLLVQVGTAVLMGWGALQIRAGMMAVGDLTAMLQLVALFRSPVAGLTGLQAQLAAADAAWERLDAIGRLPDEEPAKILPPNVKALCFRDVTFGYDADETPVFSHFSAEIPLDCWTRLSGVSGRGKSTLYRLILGLFQPNSGEIVLKTDSGEIACGAATRHLFAWVPQTPILFSGTIRENLLLYSPNVSEEELRSVIEKAQCGFVYDLPNGLDSTVGQFGEGLSIGQRQRIAVARALLSGARVLLLDEITSSLDTPTAELLLTALQKDYPAALYATHRLDLLSVQTDRQIQLEGQADQE